MHLTDRALAAIHNIEAVFAAVSVGPWCFGRPYAKTVYP